MKSILFYNIITLSGMFAEIIVCITSDTALL